MHPRIDGSSGHPQTPTMNPNTIPASDTIAPTERSMPPRPDTITSSSATASSANGTIDSSALPR